jgi:hypothetical protein
MNEGGKANLIIPYRLAYGPRGYRPVIAPYSTLLFEIEVVKLSKMPEQQGPQMPQGGGQPQQQPGK